MNLFDAAESRRLKERGIEVISSFPNDHWIKRAQATAELLAAKNGECTIDMVLRRCPRPDDVHPNACGAVFKGKKWKCLGFVNSSQVSRHAGTIRRWALV